MHHSDLLLQSYVVEIVILLELDEVNFWEENVHEELSKSPVIEELIFIILACLNLFQIISKLVEILHVLNQLGSTDEVSIIGFKDRLVYHF